MSWVFPRIGEEEEIDTDKCVIPRNIHDTALGVENDVGERQLI